MAPQRAGPDIVSYVLLAGQVVCTGTIFYFTALALSGFSATAAGGGRLIVAALFLVPVSIIFGAGLAKSRSGWLWATVYAFVGMVIPSYALSWAQQFLPTNVTAIMYSTVPLLILFWSRVILQIQISVRKWIGFAIGLGGLILLIGPDAVVELGRGGSFLPKLAVLLACFCLGGLAIIIRIMPKTSPLQATASALSIAALFSVPLVVASPPTTAPSLAAVTGLLAAGIISTAGTLVIRFTLVARRGPVFVSWNGYLAALFAVVFGVVFLGEELDLTTTIAFAVIMCGLLIAKDKSRSAPATSSEF